MNTWQLERAVDGKIEEREQARQEAYNRAFDDRVAEIECEPLRVADALRSYGMGESTETAVAFARAYSPTVQTQGLAMLNRIVRDAVCEMARAELEQERRNNECSH